MVFYDFYFIYVIILILIIDQKATLFNCESKKPKNYNGREVEEISLRIHDDLQVPLLTLKINNITIQQLKLEKLTYCIYPIF